MKETPLTQGKVAIVDDDCYDWLSQWKWYARRDGKTFYAMRQAPWFQGKRTTILMHRVILGAEPGQEIDHINGNGLDNRRFNLRFCTHAENTYNQRPRTSGTSRFKGVSWDERSGKWLPRIRVADHLIYLGLFDDELDAACAYNAAAIQYFGEFAWLNETKEGIL